MRAGMPSTSRSLLTLGPSNHTVRKSRLRGDHVGDSQTAAALQGSGWEDEAWSSLDDIEWNKPHSNWRTMG